MKNLYSTMMRWGFICSLMMMVLVAKAQSNTASPDFDKMCTYKITYPNFQAFSKNNLCKWVTQRLFFVSLHHVCT